MRKEELYETINQALAFAMANMHTTVVCKVTAVGEKTISCRPVLNRVVDEEEKPFPDFIEVPPIFINGGASYIAMPITVGDYCLLFISERCYDTWYFGSDFVKPIEMRMHDYSDGFALVGIMNKAGAINIPTVITMIGDMYANGNWEHDGDLDRNGDETVTGDRTHTGNVTISAQMQAAISVLGQASFDSIKSDNLTGVSGSFLSADSKTITVTNGIITGIA